VWRLNPRSSLHYRQWDNEWAVFDIGSGQTHEMDTMSAVILMYCESGWIALPQIVAGVATDLGLAPETLVNFLQVTLEQFESIGLLESIPQ
jgi:PqqD family protein of HPr-rel-A system